MMLFLCCFLHHTNHKCFYLFSVCVELSQEVSSVLVSQVFTCTNYACVCVVYVNSTCTGVSVVFMCVCVCVRIRTLGLGDRMRMTTTTAMTIELIIQIQPIKYSLYEFIQNLAQRDETLIQTFRRTPMNFRRTYCEQFYLRNTKLIWILDGKQLAYSSRRRTHKTQKTHSRLATQLHIKTHHTTSTKTEMRMMIDE